MYPQVYRLDKVHKYMQWGNSESTSETSINNELYKNEKYNRVEDRIANPPVHSFTQ